MRSGEQAGKAWKEQLRKGDSEDTGAASRHYKTSEQKRRRVERKVGRREERQREREGELQHLGGGSSSGEGLGDRRGG